MKVRSATGTMLDHRFRFRGPPLWCLALVTVVAAVALPGHAPAAQETRAGEPQARITLAVLPRATTLEELAEAAPDASPGILSAGLGRVAAEQTYLDIGQGNRLFDSLYPSELGPAAVVGGRVAAEDWRAIVERAEDAPATLRPGLLGTELDAAGIESTAELEAGRAQLIAVDEAGAASGPRDCPAGECPGLNVVAMEPEELERAISRLRGADLLIAMPGASPWRRLLPIAVAGKGFDGSLRSPTTRIDGYVLSTDLAPTILERLGLTVPAAMSGRPIEGGGERTAADVAELQERLEEVGPRRAPVIGENLAVWLAIALVAALLGGSRGRAWAPAVLAVTMALAPAILVAVVALDPSEALERMVVGVATPLAALTLIVAFGARLGPERARWGAFGVAAGVSLGVIAIDVLAGSPLTSLSVIGPNPGLGVRFYGIGNELEATVAMLLVLGAGAAVTAADPARPERSVSIAAAVGAAVAVAVFAPGRFGAAVGAAITFPAAAAALAIAALGVTRRRLIALLVAPLAALAALVAVDIAAGGDAHLTRSVLEAGGLEELGEVVERRTRLAAASFARFAESPFYVAALALLVAGIVGRRRIRGLFAGVPAARAAFVGGLAAAVVGTLANDSGALLLVISVAYLAAFVALAAAGREASAEGTPADT